MVSIPKYTKGRGLAMKKWEKPELNKLGVQSTEKSSTHINNVDATTYDSDGNYWDSRS